MWSGPDAHKESVLPGDHLSVPGFKVVWLLSFFLFGVFRGGGPLTRMVSPSFVVLVRPVRVFRDDLVVGEMAGVVLFDTLEQLHCESIATFFAERRYWNGGSRCSSTFQLMS